MKLTDIKELKKIANNIRISIIEQVYEAGSGHPGGALSIADIMAVLYFNQMNIDSKEPAESVEKGFRFLKEKDEEIQSRSVVRQDMGEER